MDVVSSSTNENTIQQYHWILFYTLTKIMEQYQQILNGKDDELLTNVNKASWKKTATVQIISK